MIAKRPNPLLRPVFRAINDVIPDLKPRGTKMLKLIENTYAVGIYLGPEARGPDLTFYGASIIVDPLFMTSYPEDVHLGPSLFLGRSQTPEQSWDKLARRTHEVIEKFSSTRACFDFITAHRGSSTLPTPDDPLIGAVLDGPERPWDRDSHYDLENQLVGALWEGLFDEANATLTKILDTPTQYDYEIACRIRCIARMDVLFERGLAGIRMLLENERTERLSLVRADRLS